ncbi:sensor histidine kinase [Streptomyces leeuwenhoekii]|uniref:sensor histidine kinase n=1 Tax=Streptomyces leeuwenhoekii TaxID=1437453 RepID=UPI0036F76013
MSDSVFPARSVASGRRRRRPSPTDRFTLEHVRRAVAVPLLWLLGLLGAACTLLMTTDISRAWLVTSLVCGPAAVAVVAARSARAAAEAVQAAAAKAQAADVAAVAEVAAAVDRSVRWSTDELCRGVRPPLPGRQAPRPAGPLATIETALGELQVLTVASLIRVHDESQSAVLLEVLRRLARREHALVDKALNELNELEKLTDDPDLLSKIFHIDHLVTRMRRQVESTAVLGGESLRSVRRPASVMTVLRGAISEVVHYPRVVPVAGSVGAELGLPGHVGPDLTHLLAELIENACECSDPATRVTVRAQRVPAGLVIEVEDRAVPIHPQTREEMNRLLAAPDDVDVNGQIRAGQIGLLVAAKIAHRHGLSVRLQENATGGTTALVVVPGRLLVPITPPDDAGVHQGAADRPSVSAPPRGGSAARSGPPQDPAVQPAPAGAPGAARAAHREGAPTLPRRSRRSGSFRPPSEREQAPATAARPGLAAAFREGQRAGSTGGPPAESSEPRA